MAERATLGTSKNQLFFKVFISTLPITQALAGFALGLVANKINPLFPLIMRT
jgi:hypothetical protein